MTRPAMGQPPATGGTGTDPRIAATAPVGGGAVQAAVQVDDQAVDEDRGRDRLHVVGSDEPATLEHGRRPGPRGRARRSPAGWRRARGRGASGWPGRSPPGRPPPRRRRAPGGPGRAPRSRRAPSMTGSMASSGSAASWWRRAIRRSPSPSGYPTRARSRNRSSWAWGSANVPSNSTGFCVARTRNGSGRRWVVPSIETWRSCIASSSADCVRGVARLTSSTRSTFVNTGPGHEAQAAGLEQAGPGDVRGQQVRRALDAGHPQVQRAGDRAGEERLAGARDVLEQDVAVRQQRDRDHPQRLVRADHGPRDGAAEVVPQPAAGAGRRRHGCVGRRATLGTAVRSASMDRWLLCGGAVRGPHGSLPPGWLDGFRVRRHRPATPSGG